MKKENLNFEQVKLNTISRTIRKPLMEKRRRARMNDSLEHLKQILLEIASSNNSSNRYIHIPSSKLDKADILELTVALVQQLLVDGSNKCKNNSQTCVEQIWRPW